MNERVKWDEEEEEEEAASPWALPGSAGKQTCMLLYVPSFFSRRQLRTQNSELILESNQIKSNQITSRFINHQPEKISLLLFKILLQGWMKKKKWSRDKKENLSLQSFTVNQIISYCFCLVLFCFVSSRLSFYSYRFHTCTLLYSVPLTCTFSYFRGEEIHVLLDTK